MKDGLIKKAIDASVEEKRKELTGELEHAAQGIDRLLITLRHELFVKQQREAALTLQVLAEAAERHAVTARVCEAQLTALMRMQEMANAEYTGEEKA